MEDKHYGPGRLVPAGAADGDPRPELFLVEGQSAGAAVARARDARTQAVLPFQGKPLNPLRHSPERVLEHAAYRTVLSALRIEPGGRNNLERCPYARVVLLFDPDADGVHAAALTLLFFAEFLPEFVEAGRLFEVRAPILTLWHERLTGPIDAVSRADLDRILLSLREHGIADPSRRTYRGLASMDSDALWRACLDPSSRIERRLSLSDSRTVRDQLNP